MKTQNSQSELRKLARFMTGGENHNQNRASIKCGKRKAGKVAVRFSGICTNISSYDRSAFIWFAFLCVPKIPCYLATVEHVMSRASMAAFLNNTKNFHNKYSNA